MEFYKIFNNEITNEKNLISIWKNEYNLTILYDILLTNLESSSSSLIILCICFIKIIDDPQIILSRRDHPVYLYIIDYLHLNNILDNYL